MHLDVDGGRSLNSVIESLVCPVEPPCAVGHRASTSGDPRDLPLVKAKTSEGLVAKLLEVGIVRIAVVLISESSGYL